MKNLLNNMMVDLRKCGKMNILKICTGGFRNINDTCLELSDLTALVALNSCGKSNLLAAIDFGIDFINSNCENRDNMMGWSFGVPLNKCNASQNYYFEFEAETSFEKKSYYINYRFEFEWKSDKTKIPQIVSEWLKIKRNEKGQKYNLLISRDSKAFYKSSPTGRCNTTISIGKNELVINKLQAYDHLYFLPIIKKINTIQVYIDRHLDASSSYEPDPIIRKDLSELDINAIRNIPRAIYYIKQEYKDKYELLINAYMQLFPQISQISVNEVLVDAHLSNPIDEDVPFTVCDKIYVMKVKDEFLNQPITFERLSDGAKRVFLMLTFAVIADIKGLSIIAFEEPENSIHPSLLQRYLRTLTQLVDNCKIIVTSHSPYMIQYINPNDIYIGIGNLSNNGLASFRRVAKSKTTMLLNDVEYAESSVGDYLFDLMSGSKDDLEQLSKYLENCNG